MRVEIIHDQTNHKSIRRDLIHQPADGTCEIQPGPLLGHLQAAEARQWLDKQKQIGCSQVLIFVKYPMRLHIKRSKGDRLQCLLHFFLKRFDTSLKRYVKTSCTPRSVQATVQRYIEDVTYDVSR